MITLVVKNLSDVHKANFSYLSFLKSSVQMHQNMMVGVLMVNVSTGGAWTASEFEIHINIKKITAIYYALRSFVDKLSGQHVHVQCDNSTTVSVNNNMGTTRRPECNAIAQKM